MAGERWPFPWNMRHIIRFLGSIGIALYLISSCSNAAPYEPFLRSLIVFGDGYSDIGNTFALTNARHPPAPHFRGRFSNGQIWSELVSPSLNLPLYTYAYGGSKAIQPSLVASGIPSVTQQVDELASVPVDKIKRALVVFFYAGGEFLEDASTDPNEILHAFHQSIRQLLQKGVRNLVLTTLPPLEQFPGVQLDRAERLRSIVYAYNKGIHSMVRVFSRNRDVVLWDIHGTFSTAIRNGTFNTIDRSCLPDSFSRSHQLCANRNYIFWDAHHATHEMHRLLARSFIGVVTSSWPDTEFLGHA
ncbi:hypothetical protein K493DRAFT_301128 [Basidiobolus meristosporus CBS 931.73]|uniref:SGNH hydrolase n=1 Tax=Basidiobolus meristosporus CBS 931.73 TaxID=1314790 RepID=A0A1Y1YDH3_9FUNG|nr:hypothetical protein K493DRAFT_301128 [Basidiobolus meristosporus CBS 931.73]|eukprot:ORX96042.1 hypothetical protein K493DRAFT_301128 [Basidiobolus meristosporus CBS 931.73]